MPIPEEIRTNIYTYTNGLVYTHTDERGLRITNLWDNLQRLTRVSYPDNTYVSNLYTALDLTGTKDRMNYWTYFGYNPIRQRVAETNANGVVTRYGYCDCGALLYLTNAWSTPIQQVTQYGYDYQANRTYIDVTGSISHIRMSPVLPLVSDRQFNQWTMP